MDLSQAAPQEHAGDDIGEFAGVPWCSKTIGVVESSRTSSTSRSRRPGRNEAGNNFLSAMHSPRHEAVAFGIATVSTVDEIACPV